MCPPRRRKVAQEGFAAGALASYSVALDKSNREPEEAPQGLDRLVNLVRGYVESQRIEEQYRPELDLE